MEFKNRTPEITPKSSLISQQQRGFKTAQQTVFLLQRYLGDPNLVFTDNDFSFLWTPDFLGDKKTFGIIKDDVLAQFFFIASTELWTEFPEFVDFLCKCNLRTDSIILFRSLLRLYYQLPVEPASIKTILAKSGYSKFQPVKMSAVLPKILEPMLKPQLESAKMISGEKFTPLPSLALSSEPVIICSSEFLIFEQIVEKRDSFNSCVKFAEPFPLAVMKSPEHVARVSNLTSQYKLRLSFLLALKKF